MKTIRRTIEEKPFYSKKFRHQSFEAQKVGPLTKLSHNR
ncbi:Putative protein [Zobellia galactanivorans]|uniref:Uncharacterized protein n=1 Tax=Zobellia galactanivorans (strain DSM 12802 / CCUG 47099 / CIP 106680 / NCIMB 13871 / Dsij) TaxID=63186 RepID=G0L553_ZOBGA|nr:Putative protein [Zobellia galactanivorans]